MKAIYSKIGMLALAAALFCACNEYEPVPDRSQTPFKPENARIISVAELLGNFPGNGTYGPDSLKAGFDSIPQYVAADSSLKDYYIHVVVLANDISGNLYKSLYVRDVDEDGYAINVSTDKTGLYNYYPVGQKLYIKCSGLCRGEYGGMQQLGYRYQDDNKQWKLGRIPDQMFTDHVFKDGPAPTKPEDMPKPVDITDVSQLSGGLDMLCQLVLLHKVRFAPDAVGEQFAPAPPVGSNPTSVDRVFTIGGVSGNYTLRTSTACRFFKTPVPAGEGDMVCIYTVYNSTPQFYLREFSDLYTAGFDSTAHKDRSLFYESFSGGFGAFKAVNVKGGDAWESASYGGGCVMVQAQDNNNEDWLYSRVIELPDEYNRIEATFDEAIGYVSNAGYEYLTFWIAEEKEDVSNPMDLAWEKLNIPVRHGSADWNFINVGRMDISKYKGKNVRVALKFTNGAGRFTWEVKNVQIIANK